MGTRGGSRKLGRPEAEDTLEAAGDPDEVAGGGSAGVKTPHGEATAWQDWASGRHVAGHTAFPGRRLCTHPGKSHVLTARLRTEAKRLCNPLLFKNRHFSPSSI